MVKLLALSLSLFFLWSNFDNVKGADSTYIILNEFPHDTLAFTQGFLVDPRDSDYIFEGILSLSYTLTFTFSLSILIPHFIWITGTGMTGSSQLRRVKISTGEVVKKYSINSKHFGEGVCIFNKVVYQLTWQNKIIYRYQLEEDSEGFFVSLPPLLLPQPSAFSEGWGITTDGDYLILSDGTSNIFFLSERTLKDGKFELFVVRKIAVKFNGQTVNRLNELEWINGEIWANVWLTNFIVIINPANGEVTRRINLTGLKTTGDVLNGIAYDKRSEAVYVTGKYWPKVFQIQEVPK